MKNLLLEILASRCIVGRRSIHVAKAMGSRLRDDRTNDGDNPASIQRDVERSRARMAGVCANSNEIEALKEDCGEQHSSFHPVRLVARRGRERTGKLHGYWRCPS
jgi:hypothetical protein